MNKLIYTTIAASALLIGASASLNAQDNAKTRIHADFTARMDTASDTRVTHFLKTTPLTDKAEKEALEFLYAYMPWPDMANRTPQYFLDNVRVSLQAKAEMPWGKIVPEREFRHFVLPVRVNNEDLDNSRTVFYEELRERVKGLSMKEAILEVNHWCHEKATYRPSDGRTSTPLSTVSQAIGRCGEESTFAVAALRSVGIPARQVYTPRWAHTDDNHAWVEAWADGQWWFLGACEPEPLLNMAWFNLPASRGMLMSTTTFGYYDGPEEIIGRTAINTTINVTQNYAPVSEKTVVVLDENSNTVKDATVMFMLYNYGEYYPVSTKKSDADGKAHIVSGMGDMVVWATDGRHIGIAKLSPNAEGPLTVTLNLDNTCVETFEFNIVPPKPSAKLPSPSTEEVAANEARKQYEDSVRNAYTSTFATDASARALAAELGIDPDKTSKILVESRGNHTAIATLLREAKPELRPTILDILSAVSEKDRRDIPMDVVTDRLYIEPQPTPLFTQYVLNPRIDNEGLEPFAGSFLRDMNPADVKAYRANPAQWVEWVKCNIAFDGVWNPGKLRIHPAAVWRVRKADALSRSIFFVASARAMGIPARIDQVTGKTQWHNGTDWMTAEFETDASEIATNATSTGEVEFSYTQVGRIDDPKYYVHFSISKIENGVPHLLEFDEDATLNWLNNNYRRFDEGQYILTTGQRMADGSVLAYNKFFNVAAGETTRVPFTLRQDTTAVQVIGSFNSENLFTDTNGQERSLLSATGRGYYALVYAAPNHEPTSHVLNEISTLTDAFEADGRKIVLLYADADKLNRANPTANFKLPDNVVIGHDIDSRILNELKVNLKLEGNELPVTIIADTFNRVVYVSQGYTIGTADRLLDILTRVKE